MPKYAFKFISGKYQGGEFPLPEDGELLIGRAADLDMVLVEDMVSRKHAKLVAQAGAVTLIDLGSTNGTFVNGEKIRRAELKRNDRVLIGTSILKLVIAGEARSDVPDSGDKDALKAMMSDLAKRSPASSTMSGDLEEVPLPDLLQLFSTNKKTGILSISGSNRGRLYLKEGVLEFVSL
ncbi:MAG TPA: FHA domain-containing protein, partial [Myxococcota bacterium]|nr:FHA domain-containing protein [Myxococcota bacterium]